MVTEILAAHGVGAFLQATLQAAWDTVAARVATTENRPRTAVLEGLAPAGLWVPLAVTTAGGTPAPWESGSDVTGAQLSAFAPEVILLVGDADTRLVDLPGWFELPAVQEHEVYRVAPAFVTEPGEGLAETARVLATILHPQVFTEMLPPFAVELAPLEFFTRADEG